MLDFQPRFAGIRSAVPRRRVALLILAIGLPLIALMRLGEFVAAPQQQGRANAAVLLNPGLANDRYFPGVKPDYLQTVRDDTPSSPRDHDSCFNLLDVLNRTAEEKLREASTGPATYLQLFEQPAAYRGRLVDLKGTIHWVHRLPLAENTAGLSHYYQVWLQPDERGKERIVAYVIELPEGFPTGTDLNEPVDLTGFFFKRVAYASKGGGTTAPMILAKTLQWARNKAAEPQQPTRTAPESAEAAVSERATPIESSGTAADPDIGPITGPRQLWQALGIDDEQWNKLADSQAWDPNDNQLVAAILLHLQTTPLAKIEHWSKRDAASSELAATPGEYRGGLVRLSGSVRRVVREPLDEETAERFGTTQLYRCRVDLSDGGRAVVFTSAVPAAWQLDAPIDEKAGFDGVFLKGGPPGAAGRPAELYFAARRVAWYPNTPLGKLGMDQGLLDGLAQDEPISSSESEVFYQLLQAAGRAKLADLLAATRNQRWTIVPPSPQQDQLAAQLKQDHPGLHVLFMSDPARYTGQLMAFQGRLHRCVPVHITDRETAERLGFSTYYELAIFIDLGYQQRLRPAGVDDKAAAENDAAKRIDTYPVFACVRQLPAGFPTGEKLNESVRVPGFFFKQWAYHTRFATASDRGRSEYSPLIIGPGVDWLSQPQVTADSPYTLAIAAGLAGAVLAVVVVLWRVNRRDARFRRQVLNRLVEEGSTSSAIDVEAIAAKDSGGLSPPPERLS